ncbi:MAG: hypothetical protein EP330_18580 [Deltaproteobacteria bacterium]|nr:MAG: hypothetical protein EP330_18580 [Deltaproteobacteria bacterium]
MHRIHLSLVLLVGCHAGGGDALVLTSAAAREAGHAVEIDGTDRTSIMPVSVYAGEELVLHVDGESVPARPLDGELVWLDADGPQFFFLGEDIASEALVLAGSADVGQELADLVDGELRGEVLLAGDLFLTLADQDAPDGLSELSPLPFDDPRVPAQVGHAELLAPLHTSGRGQSSTVSVHHAVRLTFGSEGRLSGQATDITKTEALGSAGDLLRDPRHVGVYASDSRCLVLDASGNARDCAATEATMRWSSEADGVVLHRLFDREVLPFTDAREVILSSAAGALTRVELR